MTFGDLLLPLAAKDAWKPDSQIRSREEVRTISVALAEVNVAICVARPAGLDCVLVDGLLSNLKKAELYRWSLGPRLKQSNFWDVYASFTPVSRRLVRDLEEAAMSLTAWGRLTAKPCDQGFDAPAKVETAKPESPTVGYCLPRDKTIKWDGEETVEPQVWRVFKHILEYHPQKTSASNLRKFVYSNRPSRDPKLIKSIRNEISKLNDCLGRITFPWRVQTGECLSGKDDIEIWLAD